MKELFVDILIIIFPILIYFICSMSEKILELKENNLLFEFCIISSIYLLLNIDNITLNIIFLNSFLIICYYKNKKICSILLSIFIIIIYGFINIYLLPILLIIYTLYYIIYKNKISYILNVITIISLILSLIINKINAVNITYIIIFIILNYLLIKLIKRLDNLYQLYKSLDDINNDKLIASSLFKITHEIKNPLAVCKGYLDMYDYNNINHSKEYIPIIKEEIDRTLVILNDFLCISKLNINCDIIDINCLLEQLINNLSILFEKNNIKINTQIIDDEIYINGDYNRLMQVFINILKNSVEAIEKEGIIEITNYVENNNIIILFKDDGIGIKDIEKIKEPFFTTKINGTGLGVPLSIEIIKKHNGIIDYESSDLGTTVTIKLPIITFNN